MKKIFYAAAIPIVLLSATSCKKEKKDTALDLMRDSVYMYAQEDYLWNNQLPSASLFRPRSYSGGTDLEALSDEVNAISQIAKDATGSLYERLNQSPGEAKYSFIDDGSVSEELSGNGGGYGFEPRYGVDDALYVKYVYPNSPADIAGIKRGDKIIGLNGRNTFDQDNKDDFNNIIDAFYGNSTSMSITLDRPGTGAFSKTLNSSNFNINPVLKVKILNSGNKKVGYMVFNSFTRIDNAKSKIDAAFATFINWGITDLIVDLRYNGGGSIETSEYLANQIAPVSADNKPMYTYYFNEGLQADKYPLLKEVFSKYYRYTFNPGEFKPENNKVFFNKTSKSSLNLGKVVFIVTGSTASASELLINNLSPYMDVKIVGETTYGKPVGFFAIPINKYQLYIPEFETRNANNTADFYKGMEPGSSKFPGINTIDDVTHDFGDAEETCVKNALNYITTGSLTVTATDGKRLNSARMLSVDQLRDLGLKLDRNFKGMVFDAKYKK